MSVGPVSLPVAAVAPTAPATLPTAASTAAATDPASGTDFAQVLQGGLDHLTKVQGVADDLAVQAATGRLQNPHDYLIAATQAQLATDLTVAVRNKAVDAFNEIMRMPV